MRHDKNKQIWNPLGKSYASGEPEGEPKPKADRVPFPPEFGVTFRAERLGRGLTQKNVAEIIDCPYWCVAQVERNPPQDEIQDWLWAKIAALAEQWGIIAHSDAPRGCNKENQVF